MGINGRGLGSVAIAVAVGIAGLGCMCGPGRAQEPSPGAEPPPGAEPGLVGDWEGHVTFADGQEARAALHLEAAGPGWRGSWELTPLDEEGPGAPQTGQVAFQRAPGPDAGLEAELPGPGTGSTRFSGRVTRAGTHAEAALIGTFQGARPGVAILWRYRR